MTHRGDYFTTEDVTIYDRPETPVPIYIGGAGAAAWAFDLRGVISIPKSAATEEQLFEIAVGAGAAPVG